MDATNKPVRQESCGFLIDGVLLLDAGTIGVQLTMPEQHRIRLVLLNHLHFDHIKGSRSWLTTLRKGSMLLFW
ncbi:MAG TPA: hypothetical protein PLO50_12735 [Nitrospira sp.]|nr:hypothetical protein [Nitrospira sp.]